MKRWFSPLGVFCCASLLVASGTWLHLRDDQGRLLSQGRQLMADGSFEKAALVLGRIQGDPARSKLVLEARALRIWAYLKAKRQKQGVAAARGLFEALPKGHPGRIQARLLLARALGELGQKDQEARIFGERAAALLGSSEQARVAGYYLRLAEEAEQGRPSTDPLKPATKPDPRLAVRFYREALSIMGKGPGQAAIILPLARNLLKLPRGSSKARSRLEKLLKEKLKPAQEAEARYLLARALKGGRAFDLALAELDRLLAVRDVLETPFAPLGLELKGSLLVSHRKNAADLRHGVAAWEAFLRQFPDHKQAAKVRERIADAFFDAAEPALALKRYEELAAHGGIPPEARARALFQVARCREQMEEWDAARTAYQRFLSRFPDNRQVPAAQARLPKLLLFKARQRLRVEDLSGAVLAYQEYVRLYPLQQNAAAVAVEAGLVLRKQKKFKEAVTALKAARDRYRLHDRAQAARAAYLLGVILEEDEHKLPTAIAAFEAVVKDYPRTPSARAAAQRLRALKTIELALESPRPFIPGESSEVNLTLRNIPEATFRIYRLDAREAFERRGSLESASKIEVALVKADRSFTYKVPSYAPYQRFKLPVQLFLKEGHELPEGSYLVTVEAEQRRAVVLVLVSSIRLVVKKSPHELFVWAVDAKSGEPKQGVEVLLRGPKVEDSKKTDQDGVARFHTAGFTSNLKLLGVLGQGVAPGLSGAAAFAGKRGRAPRVSFTLDRPLYRPGSRVSFQAILRDVVEGSFVTPKPGKHSVRLLDPQGRVVGELMAETGPFGTLHGALDLPPEGDVGDYRLELLFAGARFHQVVTVRAFLKPEYRVAIKPREAVVRPGESVTADVTLQYEFGGPVAHAQVEWSVFVSPLKLDKQRYRSQAWYLQATKKQREQRSGGRFVARGTVYTDARGRANFFFKTRRRAGNEAYLLVAMVQDSAHGLVRGLAHVAAGLSDRFAVVLADRRTYRAGDEAHVRVITRDLLQRAIQGTGRLVGEIERQVEGHSTWKEAVSADVDTGLVGEGRVRLKLPEAGTWRLRFLGRDIHGRSVVAETRVVVDGKLQDLKREIRLRFEQGVVKGGGAASMHLSVPVAGRPLLITFEGEQVLDYRILRPTETFQVLPLLVPARLAPNVTVAAALPFKNRLLVSKDKLVVLRYLAVEVKPEKSRATRGEKIKVQIGVKDQLGRPVAASLALRVADRALLGLGGLGGSNPLFVFNRDQRPHLVRTSSSFAFKQVGPMAFLDPDLVALHEEKQDARRLEDVKRLGEVLEKSSALFANEPAAAKKGGFERPAEEKDVEEDEDAYAADKAPTANAPGKWRRGRKKIQLRSGGGGSFGGVRGGRLRESAKSKGRNGRMRGFAQEQGRKLDEIFIGKSAENRSVLSVIRKSNAFKNLKSQDVALLLADQPSLGGYLAPPEIRRHFVDVAAWWPAVVTGADGQAARTFTLPDNLTTWDLRAVAAGHGASVGEAQASLQVTQPLVLQVERPRQLSSRDQVKLPAVIHRSDGRSLPVTLSLNSKSPAVLEGEGMSQLNFQLLAGGSSPHLFSFRAKGAGLARLEGAATSAAGQDGLEVGLSVFPFGEPWSQIARGPVGSGRVLSARVTIPDNVVPGSGRYRVVLRAGVAGLLLEGLTYLSSYPYGCLEQTVHRFLPAMLLAAAAEQAGRPLPLDAVKLRQNVERGCRALLGFQTSDGAFSYWPGHRAAQPWATALALQALSQAQRLGYEVPPALLRNALAGASRLLKRRGLGLETRATLLHALTLAGRGQSELLNTLYRRRQALSVAGVSRVLLAAVAMQRSPLVDSLLGELRRRRQADGSFAKRRVTHDGWVHSGLETAALALLAFQAAQAPEAGQARLIKRIQEGLKHREGSTQGVALGLMALARAGFEQASLKAGGSVSVWVDGRPVASAKSDARHPLLVLSIPPKSLPAGSHRIQVKGESLVPLEGRIVLEDVRRAAQIKAAGRLLAVERRMVDFRDPDAPQERFEPGYSIVKPESRPKRVVRPSLGQVVVGRKVTVELELTARRDLSFLVLRDPQLAGMEVIQQGIRGGFDRYERRASELLFFKNNLKQGQTLHVSYPAYVLFEGRFHALPAQAFEMYAPERRGRSDSLELAVVGDPSFLASTAPRKPTPDERWHAARKAFKKGDYAFCVETLKDLPGQYDLKEDVHDELLKLCLISELRRKAWRSAVSFLDALKLRNPDRLLLELADQERLGRAYLAVGEPEQGETWFRAVLSTGFEREVRLATTYGDLGEPQRRIEHLLSLRLRYPFPDARRIFFDVAALELSLPAAVKKKAAGHKRGLSAMRWREALDGYLAAMAWNQGTPLAEAAARARLAIWRALSAQKPLVAECRAYLRRHPDGPHDDLALYREAQALFTLSRFDEAGRAARAVWDWKRPSKVVGAAPRLSTFRHEAAYLLGKLAHVKGDYKEAVAWYGRVRKQVADARQSWLFFTEERLVVEPLLRASGAGSVKLPVRAKNISRITIQIYPVDLLVLFAVKKSFERLNTAELAGVSPMKTVTQKTGLKEFREGALALDVGELPEGAYLVLLRGGKESAGTLLLNSGCHLTIQRGSGAMRVYLTDGAGKPLPEARVKLAHRGHIVHSGRTDARGMLDIADPGAGPVTVVAVKGEQVAVARR